MSGAMRARHVRFYIRLSLQHACTPLSLSDCLACSAQPAVHGADRNTSTRLDASQPRMDRRWPQQIGNAAQPHARPRSLGGIDRSRARSIGVLDINSFSRTPCRSSRPQAQTIAWVPSAGPCLGSRPLRNYRLWDPLMRHQHMTHFAQRLTLRWLPEARRAPTVCISAKCEVQARLGQTWSLSFHVPERWCRRMWHAQRTGWVWPLESVMTKGNKIS